MSGYDYLKKIRKVTDEDIAYWHILSSDDCIQFPLLDFSRKYVFTIKKKLVENYWKWDYPKDAPTGFYVYGLDNALQSILDRGFVIAVEGAFDCLSMHREGLTNTIGMLSNNMTRWQGLKLRRWTNNLLLLTDGDAGGEEGRKKTTEVLKKFFDFQIYGLVLPKGDPDNWLNSSMRDVFLSKLDSIAQKIQEK